MKRTPSSPAVLVVALVALALAPSVARAWGANGHRIVARIGEDHLSPQARAGVRAIAGGQSLALLATWPDYIRSFREWDCVQPWHFLTVEDDETLAQGLERKADLARLQCEAELFTALGMPNNVVEAIEYFAAIVAGDEERATRFNELLDGLGAEPYDGSVRLTALALLVHFVGDVHQPLHVGRGGDRGGNSITVEWFDELENLHSLWDSGLLDHEGLSFSEQAQFLEQEFTGRPGAESGLDFDLELVDPAAWAQESMNHRGEVYDIVDPRNPAANLSRLSYRYAADRSQLLKQRLYAGGMRLAQLVNSIFETEGAGNAP